MITTERAPKPTEEQIADWLEDHPLSRNLMSLTFSTIVVTWAIVGFGSTVGYDVPIWSVASAFIAGSFASRVIFGQIEAAGSSRGTDGSEK